MDEELNLHGTTDAVVWAKEFCRLFPDADEGLMLGWFANAIMAGVDSVPRTPAWQGISTAPKDGTEFDIWCVKREGYTNYPARIANCRHNEGVLEYLHSHGWFALKGAWEGREVIITHWMPRPEPPTDEGEKE